MFSLREMNTEHAFSTPLLHKIQFISVGFQIQCFSLFPSFLIAQTLCFLRIYCHILVNPFNTKYIWKLQKFKKLKQFINIFAETQTVIGGVSFKKDKLTKITADTIAVPCFTRYQYGATSANTRFANRVNCCHMIYLTLLKSRSSSSCSWVTTFLWVIRCFITTF